MELRAAPHMCEEASPLSTTKYIPCNQRAVSLVKLRNDGPYRMCYGCADHNVKNRGGVLVGPYTGGGNVTSTSKDVTTEIQPEDYQRILGTAAQTVVQGRRIKTFGISDLAIEVAKYVESQKSSPTGLAAAFITIRQLSEAIDEAVRPINTLLGAIKNKMIPELFENEKTRTVTVEVGGVAYRVSVAELMRASIRASETDPDIKAKAYEWLRKNGLGELITETVNSSTLSATAKSLIEEGKELDPDLFNVAVMPNTSITKVAAKVGKTKKDEA